MKVLVSLNASKLPNVGFRRCNPVAVVTLPGAAQGEEVGRTEVLQATANPQWATVFEIDYVFGRSTTVVVSVYDVAPYPTTDGRRTVTLLGRTDFEVGSVLMSRGSVQAHKFTKGGLVFAHVEQLSDTANGPHSRLHFTFHGFQLKLSSTSYFAQPSLNAFFEISRPVRNPDGSTTWRPVVRSVSIPDDEYPRWEPMRISLRVLCSNDVDKPLRVEVFHFQSNGLHRPIGSFETTVRGLLGTALRRQPSFALPLANTGGNALSDLPEGKEVKAETLLLQASFPLVEKGKCNGKILVPQARLVSLNMSSRSLGLTKANSHLSLPRHQNDISTNSQTAPTSQSTGYPSSSQTPESSDPQQHREGPRVSRYATAQIRSSPQTSRQQQKRLYWGNQQEDFATEERLQRPPPPPLPDSPGSQSPRPHSSGAPNFIDYLIGGCQIQLCVAIDFTAANGSPEQPDSLHFIDNDNPDVLNDYERALHQICSVVAKYDSDQKFPLWGFGAVFEGRVRNCFQLSATKEVSGIEGILQAYRDFAQSGPMQLSRDPACLDEVVRIASRQAEKAQRAAEEEEGPCGQRYTILLVLTASKVNRETAWEAIYAACDKPLSIVVVGVGESADVECLQFLDNLPAPRDIVNFVDFQRFRDCASSLGVETLKEIPDQLVGYFCGRHIYPNARTPRPMEEIEATAELSSNTEYGDWTYNSEDDVPLTNASRGQTLG